MAQRYPNHTAGMSSEPRNPVSSSPAQPGYLHAIILPLRIFFKKARHPVSFFTWLTIPREVIIIYLHKAKAVYQKGDLTFFIPPLPLLFEVGW